MNDNIQMRSLSFPSIEENNSLSIAFHNNDYEFIGMSIEGNLNFKKHEIKIIDSYIVIKNKLSDMFKKYGNLLTNTEKNNEIGIDLSWIIKNLQIRWARPNHINFEKYKDIYVKKILSNDLLKLPYTSTAYFNKCMFNKLTVNAYGEIILNVVYSNNGVSIFGTLHKKEEDINLRDIDNIQWYKSISNIIDAIDNYLGVIQYNDKLNA